MDLEELKTIVDDTISHLNTIDDAKDISVLITLSENSIGGRASCSIKYACLGFDWEHGQFRIEPTKNLVKMGNTITDTKEVITREYNGKKYYKCPRCEMIVAKKDKYCRACSQKLI